MAKRTIQRDPELLAHQQWLGYLQPVGLVVAPAAMQEAGWVVTRSGSELIERQERYREALEALGADEDGDADDRIVGFSSIETLLVDHLGWSADQVHSDPELIKGYIRELPELGETLQPTALVPAASGEGTQLLVQELPLLTPLDQKFSSGDQHWRATAQERFERLLREAGIEAGLLFNGSQLRLVVAPKGESSGHLTFTLKDLAEVSGRLMFSGLDLLLGQSHVFLDPDGYRLVDVLNKSRSYQAVVSNALADQVLAALWDLLRGFERADQLSQQQGSSLLGNIPDAAPEQLYGGLITVLMRFVFLLYAEDEALMPTDAIYEQNYKVSSIFEQLQQDAAEFPDTMEERFGAWAGLMSLCRLVFDGGGDTADYLPARHGQLFDPEPYPWLETPWISDGAVYSVLGNLLVVNGERINYRALDVEQIGSVYEGIMGYRVMRTKGPSIGIKSKPQGAKKQITTVIDILVLLNTDPHKRNKLLDDEAQCVLPEKAANALLKSKSESDVLEALSTRTDNELFDGIKQPGSLIFQPTEERRRSGSHYTPRSLTRPIVEEALRPWLDRHDGLPSENDILMLRICDPAMGSGAFLVESCRYLAEILVSAWSRDGLPDALRAGGSSFGEEPLIHARRIIAQTCIYGVDKNIFAVNLAKLSLWLISLSKNLPFTFVDHALKRGDSLVGPSDTEVVDFIKSSDTLQADLFGQRSHELLLDSGHKRVSSFNRDTLEDTDEIEKRHALAELEEATNPTRLAGKALVASFFNATKDSDRKKLRKAYASMLIDSTTEMDAACEIRETIHDLSIEHQVHPFLWHAEFPEVFSGNDPGFDVFVGNPPFLGTLRITEHHASPLYLEWLKAHVSKNKGHIDMCAFFFIRSFHLLNNRGSAGFLATSNISRGDNRVASLEAITKEGGKIYSAKTDMPWPGAASVVVSVVHFSKESDLLPKKGFFLNNESVVRINSSLGVGEERTMPARLVENIGKAFQGTNLGGNGFVLSDEEASRLLQDPHNRSVIKRLVGGDEVNGNLKVSLAGGGRMVISFSSMTEEEASEWPEILAIVRERIKPHRDKAKDHGPGLHGKKYWWQHTLRADPLYASLSELKSCLVKTYISRYHIISECETDVLFNNRVCVYPFDSPGAFAVLQSNLHRCWAAEYCSRMGFTVAYSIKEAFETFPFPLEITGSPLEQAGIAYMALRDQAANGLGLSLTALYSKISDAECSEALVLSMRSAVRMLDEEVLRAYGYTAELKPYGFVPDSTEVLGEDNDSPAANKDCFYSFDPVDRDIILGHLLNENLSRASRQIVEGVSFKNKGTTRKKSSAKSPRRTKSTPQDQESLF